MPTSSRGQDEQSTGFRLRFLARRRTDSALASSLTPPPLLHHHYNRPSHHHEVHDPHRPGLSRHRFRGASASPPRRSHAPKYPFRFNSCDPTRRPHCRSPGPPNRLFPRPVPSLDYSVWGLQHARDRPEKRRHRRRDRLSLCLDIRKLVQSLRWRDMDGCERC